MKNSFFLSITLTIYYTREETENELGFYGAPFLLLPEVIHKGVEALSWRRLIYANPISFDLIQFHPVAVSNSGLLSYILNYSELYTLFLKIILYRVEFYYFLLDYFIRGFP